MSSMEDGKYARELDVAVRAVHMACQLCQKVQEGLIKHPLDQVQLKEDTSLVTVADWSVQATVSWVLTQVFGDEHVSIIAEEDARTLSDVKSRNLLHSVVDTVNECLAEAHRYGFISPDRSLTSSEVLEAIVRCNSSGGHSGRHWVLDPVDGTLGFVRLDQYAVGLALIDNGGVLIGVLGCPNYPMKKEWLHCHNTIPNLASEKGCVIYAMKGSGEAWMQPFIHEGEKFEWPNFAKRICVSSIDDPEMATFCEPVEKANSNHSFTQGVANIVGFRKQPLRVYSMVKYAAIARGDAEIFMKFARFGYKEKIWDHAAGVLVVQEAGGMVTDAGGQPLDFSRGIYLEGLDRGIIACCGSKMHEKLIGAVYASWESSNL